MPTCGNCGSHVSATYARVVTPDGIDEPRACPGCEDKIRVDGKVREARAARTGRRVSRG